MPAISALAELVIPGLQAIGWLYLIGCIVLGWQWLSPIDDKLPSQIVLVIVGALAYTLGVAVDRVADSLLTTIMDRIKPPPPGRRAELVKMRVRVHGQGGDISEHLQYVRSRLRIVRSTILNLAVATLILAALAAVGSTGGPDQRTISFALVIVLVGLIVFVWTWRRMEDTYGEGLTEAFKQIGSRTSS